MLDQFFTEKVSGSITRIRMPGETFGYYLEGNQAGLLVDTGYGYGNLKAVVDSLATKPYRVVLTHGHVDHAGGTVQFEKVYVHKRDYPVTELHTEIGFRTAFLKNTEKDVDESKLQPAKPMEEYHLLEDEAAFDLGGLHAISISLPGHTPGSIVVYIPELRTMIFGDALNSMTFLQMPESISVEEYRANLLSFRDKYQGAFDQVLYSHPHNVGGPEVVTEMLELCDEVLQGAPDSVDMSDSFGPGARIAKSFDPTTFSRLDGKQANLIYRTIFAQESTGNN